MTFCQFFNVFIGDKIDNIGHVCATKLRCTLICSR